MYAQARGEFQSCPHTWTNKCYILNIRTQYDKMAKKIQQFCYGKIEHSSSMLPTI